MPLDGYDDDLRPYAVNPSLYTASAKVSASIDNGSRDDARTRRPAENRHQRRRWAQDSSMRRDMAPVRLHILQVQPPQPQQVTSVS